MVIKVQQLKKTSFDRILAFSAEGSDNRRSQDSSLLSILLEEMGLLDMVYLQIIQLFCSNPVGKAACREDIPVVRTDPEAQPKNPETGECRVVRSLQERGAVDRWIGYRKRLVLAQARARI